MNGRVVGRMVDLLLHCRSVKSPARGIPLTKFKGYERATKKSRVEFQGSYHLSDVLNPNDSITSSPNVSETYSLFEMIA